MIPYLFDVRAHERGLLFRKRQFERVLQPGHHVVFSLPGHLRLDLVSVRDPWLVHPDLDVIVRSGALDDAARVLDLADHQRALVKIDGRLAAVLRPGLHALWTVFRKVETQIVDANALQFEHPQLAVVLAVPGAREALDSVVVEAGHVGLLFRDGQHAATLRPGTHAFWKNVARQRVVSVDLREQVADIAGQELMTADKVTLRLNAVVSFRVVDALRTVTAAEDFRQSLYREAQLLLRAAVGARELDALLVDKQALARDVAARLEASAGALGLQVLSFGVRDVILPGEMKEILNRVTTARKAAEANLITRREEVAAMRSQANTARIFESNPTLMRLKELEVLEAVATKGKLTVVLGEQGLTERVVKLL